MTFIRIMDKNFIMNWDGKPLRFSFPVIRRRSYGLFGDSGVYLNGVYKSGELAQNMDAIGEVTLADTKTRYFFKMAARLVIKDQLAQKAEESFGLLGKIGASVYGAVSETADTRSWSFLPASFFVTRIRLEPGTHKVRIKTYDRSSGFRTIKIKPGEVRFLRDVG